MQREYVLSKSKYKDPKRLEPYGFNVYSHTEVEGILVEIFKRIGITGSRFFVDFCVSSPYGALDSNTHFLLFQGFEGVFIEESESSCRQISRNFQSVIDLERLTILHSEITPQNVDGLISQTKAGKLVDIDLLSIHHGGNDYHLFQAIKSISPRVVLLEFCNKFPPPIECVMPYNKNYVWSDDDVYGASLESTTKLADSKGYQLVGTDLRGWTAFFVRKDLCKDRFVSDASAKNLYNNNIIKEREIVKNKVFLDGWSPLF